MSSYNITGSELKNMVSVAASYLERNKKGIDALNVFPVPDGDTGTNMSLTMHTAANEARQIETDSVSDVAAAMSLGALKGARGNSGVILSQIFRGMASGLNGKETMNGTDLATAMRLGTQAAYKAVMKPREGTVLTVVRAMAEAAERSAKNKNTVDVVLNDMIQYGEEILQKTPDMLPVLKEAGVVDAGGVGLIVIFKGMKLYLDGEELPPEDEEIKLSHVVPVDIPTLETEIEFGYCTEFFVKNTKSDATQGDLDRLRDKLAKIGDSLLVVGDPNLIKVHVHTNAPGQALQLGLELGELSAIKIDNMREQHQHIIEESNQVDPGVPQIPHAGIPSEALKEYGIVTVSSGEGLEAIFKDIGTDVIVEGGQSMNPSTDDIEKAIISANAKNVFVFPNNSNIIMAAQQAAELADAEHNIKAAVIPSRSVPQGISSIISFSSNVDFEVNTATMKDVLKDVKSGLVTYSVRDTKLNGKTIKEGDILGMQDGDITTYGKDITKVVTELLEKMITEEDETITIFYGEEVSEQDAEKLLEKLEEKFSDCDLQLYSGGQPLYYYILGVE